MYCTSITKNWTEGLISTGEAIMQILMNKHDDDAGKYKALAFISLELQKQEQAEADLTHKYDGCPNDYRPNS